MPAEAAGGMRVWLYRGLTAFGAVCLIAYAFLTLQNARYQRNAKAEIDQRVTAARTAEIPEKSPERPPDPVKPLVTGDLIGRVDIPRLKLSAAVAEGDDNATLGRAVGHLPDTPLPWARQGNVGLAAHRDGLFRELEHIRLNDEVRVVTPRGEYHYRVRKTQIVDPDDVWVLAPTETPYLTLITCYPFSFIGNAPQRFIVQAEYVGQVAGAVLTGTVVQ
jgi:LPXTG-site transpeptidase (sortase) family protein